MTKTLDGQQNGTHQPEINGAIEHVAEAVHELDRQRFMDELIKSREEVEIARKQFETVTDPLLIDHIVFRLGAAERRFDYLFQLAKRWNLSVDGIYWEWYERR